VYTGFWWGNLRERERGHLEDPDMDGRIILRYVDFQEVGCGSRDGIDLARDKDSCRALVNTVMKLRAPQNAGNCLTS